MSKKSSISFYFLCMYGNRFTHGGAVDDIARTNLYLRRHAIKKNCSIKIVFRDNFIYLFSVWLNLTCLEMNWFKGFDNNGNTGVYRFEQRIFTWWFIGGASVRTNFQQIQLDHPIRRIFVVSVLMMGRSFGDAGR